MFSIERLRAVLAVLVFLSACFFAGFTNETLKQTLPDLDRAVLLIGFILGAGAAMRWIASGSIGNAKRGNRRT
jgi:uncharacterized membrane-anchored protein YitT (DUF2179 family)